LGAGLARDIAASVGKLTKNTTRGLASQANEHQGFLGVEVLSFGD
jgi:hypothetical protein